MFGRLKIILKEKIAHWQIDKKNTFYDRVIDKKNIFYSEAQTLADLKENLTKRGIDRSKFTGKNLNIFWVSASEKRNCPDFLQALGKFGTIGFLKKEDGSLGQEFSDSEIFNSKVRKRNDKRLLEQVETYIKEHGSLDILIGQMWANYISLDAIKKIKEMGVVVVNVAMNDKDPVHWQRVKDGLMGAVGLGSTVDLTLNTSYEYCIRYKMHNGLCVFWPLASDAEVFKPAKVKDIDVCFVGNNYGIRGKIIDALLKKGVKVEAYGKGFSRGAVSPDKIPLLYGRSKIIVGVGTIGDHKDVYQLKYRDFNATMSGALYITSRHDDLQRIFKEGCEIEYYSDIKELLDKVMRYLEEKDKIIKISNAIYEKSRECHTWEKRIKDMFGYLA